MPALPRGPSLLQFLMTTNSLSTCCESGGRTLTDSGPAASAQAPVYCPVYESRLLATARHELNSAAALGVYGGPYGGSQGYGNYVTYGSEASAFYSLVRGGNYPKPSPSPATPRPSPRNCQTSSLDSGVKGAGALDPRLEGAGQAHLSGFFRFAAPSPAPRHTSSPRVWGPCSSDHITGPVLAPSPISCALPHRAPLPSLPGLPLPL